MKQTKDTRIQLRVGKPFHKKAKRAAKKAGFESLSDAIRSLLFDLIESAGR